jgi:5'-nucleotidase
MKFLLTNDDGIDAPGLHALKEAAESLGQVAIVAPVEAYSGCSHTVTTDRPILVELRGNGRSAVDGTPADCVRVALHRLAPDFDWVLSGINAGGNLGADVYLSGTVAAVRESVLHGRPGVAVSYYRTKDLDFDWPRAGRWVRRLLPELLAQPRSPGVFWNVNLPHLPPDAPDPEVVRCRLDPHPLPLSFREDGGGKLFYDGNYHSRRRAPGCDVDVCFNGRIAVTQLNLFD